MSTIKVTNLQNASAASPAIVLDANSRATLNGLSYPTEGSLSGRNRIINGDMRIDQRNAGASVSLTTPATYVIDRWAFRSNTSITVQRSTTAPTGFVNSAYVTVPTGGASSSGHFNLVQQSVEGFNFADLGWGSGNAKSVTLSFWVRSSLTGVFAGALRNGAGDRSYVFNYSISVANTWEFKSITVAGDTTGTWATDNSAALIVGLDLGSGSTYATTAGAWSAGNYITTSGAVQVTVTSGATFYITGVQLEAGSVATPFERRSYGQELALCQRYFQKVGAYSRQVGAAISVSTVSIPVPTPVTMRATPSFSGSISQMKKYDTGGVTVTGATYSILNFGDSQIDLSIGNLSVSDNAVYWVSFNASSLSAEL